MMIDDFFAIAYGSQTSAKKARACTLARQQRPTVPIYPCLLLAGLLAGCDGSNSYSPASPVAPTLPPHKLTLAGHGHYEGTVTIGNEAYQGHALLTVDGAVRIHVGRRIEGDVPPPIMELGGDVSGAGRSAQFLGNLDVTENQGLGAGVVIGQSCAAPNPGRFCDGATPAEISIADVANGTLDGEVRVRTSEGEEVWLLDMAYWSIWYDLGADLVALGGNYKEVFAQFAQAGDVTININNAGQLFFQSGDSGCTANGNLSPHLDGKFFVFDVKISIDNCDTRYDFLNNDFVGLATTTQSGLWSYDEWLVMFLSTPGRTAPQAAVTLYASRY